MNDIKLCDVISRKLNRMNNLLYIGCGAGFLAGSLAKKLNSKIACLDISTEGFVNAHNQCKKFDACNLIECIRGDANNMKMFKNSEFDAVMSFYVLHNINTLNVVLKETKRVLKPDGRVNCGCPPKEWITIPFDFYS